MGGAASSDRTDADLVLGKIDPGVLRRQDQDRSSEAGGGPHRCHRCPARPHHRGRRYGVAEIVDENMANAARVHAVERALPVAERTLVASRRGAAPMPRAWAEKLGITRVVVRSMPALDRPLAFSRRLPPTSCALALHAPGPFDVSAANQLLDDMSRDASRRRRQQPAGRWLGEMRARSSCLRRPGSPRSPSRFRRVRLMLAIPNTSCCL